MPKQTHLVEAVRAAYRLDCTDPQWLAELTERLACMVGCTGAVACFSCRTHEGWLPWGMHPVDPCTWQHANRLLELNARPSEELRRRLYALDARCISASQAGLLDFPEVRHVLGPEAADAIHLAVLTPEGVGCAFVLLQDRPRSITARTMRSWGRVLTHVAAALRQGKRGDEHQSKGRTGSRMPGRSSHQSAV